MKKLLLLLPLMATLMLSSCSKDDDNGNGFPVNVNEVLTVMNGRFVYNNSFVGVQISKTTLVFSLFDAPTPKNSSINDVPMKFCGKVTKIYESSGSSDQRDYYFYVDTAKKQLVMYATVSDENRYNAYVSNTYDYSIKDANSFQLHDIRFSSTNWELYQRQ